MELINLSLGGLDLKDVYLCMGTGGSNGDIKDEISEVIERMSSLALKLMRIRYALTIVPLEITADDQIILAQKYTLICNAKFFEGAARAAVILVTLGPDLEHESAELFRQGQFLEGLALDACGISALNLAVEKIRTDLAQRVSPERLGYSLNPGCHMIPLTEQQIVFSLLDGEELGVKLTESSLMVPVKTTSIIVPIGEKLAKIDNSNHACEICNRQNSCSYKQQKPRL